LVRVVPGQFPPLNDVQWAACLLLVEYLQQVAVAGEAVMPNSLVILGGQAAAVHLTRTVVQELLGRDSLVVMRIAPHQQVVEALGVSDKIPHLRMCLAMAVLRLVQTFQARMCLEQAVVAADMTTIVAFSEPAAVVAQAMVERDQPTAATQPPIRDRAAAAAVLGLVKQVHLTAVTAAPASSSFVTSAHSAAQAARSPRVAATRSTPSLRPAHSRHKEKTWHILQK
jgi:hypothetical protein